MERSISKSLPPLRGRRRLRRKINRQISNFRTSGLNFPCLPLDCFHPKVKHLNNSKSCSTVSPVQEMAQHLLVTGQISMEEYTKIISSDHVYRLHETQRQQQGCNSNTGGEQCHDSYMELVKILEEACESARSDDSVEFRDPITLEMLGKHVYTFHSRTNNFSMRYNVESLARYLLETGHFEEPTTRIELNLDDLYEIQKKVDEAGIDLSDCSPFTNLVTAYKNPKVYQDKKERQDLIEGLERCVGEVVTSFLEIVEDKYSENGQVKLCMHFAHFTHFFKQLAEADEHYALQCLERYGYLIRGPPNRPVVDKSGLLQYCLQFFDERREELRSISAKNADKIGGRNRRNASDAGDLSI